MKVYSSSEQIHNLEVLIMKLTDLNKRQRKIIETFRIHFPIGPYLDSGKFHGAGKGTIESLVDLKIIQYSDQKYKYKLTEVGLKLLA